MNDKEKKEMMKELEQEFHNAMDVLQIHKNMKWKPEQKGFMFGDKYFIYSNFNKRFPKKHEVLHTTLKVELRDDIEIKLEAEPVTFGGEKVYRVGLKMFSKRYTNPDDYINSNFSQTLSVDYETLKLQKREIGKVRSIIKKLLNIDKLLLGRIENFKRRLADAEERLKELPDSINDWKELIQETEETYAKHFEQSEVA